MLSFDDITLDGRLWAVRYEGAEDNALYETFAKWNDVMWLRDFFPFQQGGFRVIFQDNGCQYGHL